MNNKGLMAKSGLNLDAFALHSLRIFGTTTLEAGGDISRRKTEGERRWKSDAYKAYTRNNRGFEKGVTYACGGTRRERGSAGGRDSQRLKINNSI